MIKVMLRSILREKKMTLTELSKLTDISLKALSAFQNQKTDGIKYNTLDKISTALGLEIGELIKQVNQVYELKLNLLNEIHINEEGVARNIKAEFLMKDYFDKVDYISDLTFDVKLTESNSIKKLSVYIKEFNHSKLPADINHYITKEVTAEINEGIVYIISHLIIYEVIKSKYIENINIYDDVYVYWGGGVYPKFVVDPVNVDTIRYENDRIIFTNRDHKINLVPLNPSELIAPHAPDLSIPYTANIEAISNLPIVYNVEIDDEYERTVYITLD